jgi:hypothetical protein
MEEMEKLNNKTQNAIQKDRPINLERVEQMKIVQEECLELFKKKNQDYGDAFATYGPIGVIVRMGDKIQRLLSINNSGIQLVNNEGLRDTLIDLHNYSAMAILLLDNKDNKNNLDIL